MSKAMRRSAAIAVAIAMVLSLLCVPVFGADKAAVLTDTASYVIKTVSKPEVGSIGGEWAVLGLARSGAAAPETYYQDYYDGVVQYVKACDGVLHDKKYTEYSRVTLALTAIGADPTNVGGYNLLEPLGDFDKTIWQGINGPVFALIALDSGNYAIPVNSTATTQATREMYIEEILSRQLSDGGFSLTGGTSSSGTNESADADITAMTLQALAKYQDQAEVKKATEEALVCLSNMQESDGGFSSWGAVNVESVVQVIVALTELGIPLDDSRFVKNGNTVVDNLLSHYAVGSGFVHALGASGSNMMATEQGLYALTAISRADSGANSLYRMGDAKTLVEGTAAASGGNGNAGEGTNGAGSANGGTVASGLAGKHDDVKASSVSKQGTTFADIASHENKAAIETLAERAIINGKSDNAFDPDNTMTRAEFAVIIINALGLEQKTTTAFTDVESGSWYAGYVGAAYEYGIVSGTSATTFNPQGTITRQEAAVMVAKAAALCGLEEELQEAEIRDMLAQFADYTQAGSWARESLAFCYKKDILSQEDLSIEPKTAITRCQVAQMVYQMLGKAELL